MAAESNRAPGRRALLSAALVATAGLGAAGCVRIPMDSSPRSTPISSPGAPGAPYVQPRRPADGATPEQIVTGFVQAGVGGDGDYQAARLYLTQEARQEWNPAAGVTVYAGDREFTVAASTRTSVSLTVQAVAQVDQTGLRTVLSSPSARSIDVPVVQVDGQWRISRPPAGIFLSEAAFEILFTAGRLYFLGSRERHLVPDLRWVPAEDAGPTLLTRLAQGPAPWLGDAVRTALPGPDSLTGTTIDTARDGAAEVALPAALGALAPARRTIAVSQILATLQSLPNVGQVRMSAGSVRLSPPTDAPARPAIGSRVVAAARTGIIAVEDGRAGAQLVPDLARTAVADPVLAAGSVLAAACRPDRGAVLIASTDRSLSLRAVSPGSALVGPRLDDAGFVWTTPAQCRGVLHALRSRAGAGDVQVSAPWLTGRNVRGIDISADATRMLVVSDGGGAVRVDMCAVLRDAAGTPRALTEPLQLAMPADDVHQATWFDELAVIMLGITEQGALSAAVVDPETGTEVLPTPVAGTVRLAGTASAGGPYASTREARLLRSDGTRWVDTGVRATDPSVH